MLHVNRKCFFFDKLLELVGGGSVINGAYPIIFFYFFFCTDDFPFLNSPGVIIPLPVSPASWMEVEIQFGQLTCLYQCIS